MADITEARKALVARILEGKGTAPPPQSRAAFDNAGLAEPLRTLIDKVARYASSIRPQRGRDIRARRVRRYRPGHAAVRHRARGPRGRNEKERTCVSRFSIAATVSE